MSSNFLNVKNDFILKTLIIFERHGGLVPPGKEHPYPQLSEGDNSTAKYGFSHIELLVNELGEVFNDLVNKLEVPVLKFYFQKRKKVFATLKKGQLPKCFGFEHDDNKKNCQFCGFEFDCSQIIEDGR